MPRTIAPEVARAALDKREAYRENRLALQLPMPEHFREPMQAQSDADDAAALVLDRDGNFTTLRF